MTVPTLGELIVDLDKIDADDVDAYHAAFAHMVELYPGAGDEILLTAPLPRCRML